MKMIKTVQSLKKTLTPIWNSSQTLGLVPTMGALHEGHLSLIRASVKDNDYTIVSIFVNPLQFGKNEDLGSYPRRLKADIALAQEAGANFVFAPDASAFYDENHQTYLNNPAVSSLYCGAYRSGHFEGVLTVVAKLFLATNPSISYFGKKDYQQAFLLKKMVTDLNWNMKVKTISTKRQKSGLALSSRNEYLNSEQKEQANIIYQSLKLAKQQILDGETSVAKIQKGIIKACKENGCSEVQYLAIASQKTLLPLKKINEKSVLLFAGYWGKTRLIDNIEVA